MIAALWGRVWGYVAAAGAVLAAVAGVWLSGRRAGRDAAAADAARQGEEARARGEAAERQAQRDGAAERLRRGGF
jgi:uncharacterized membrane protein YdjX (TVP38/TMEM64 family)